MWVTVMWFGPFVAHWNQDLSLLLLLAFWNPLSLEGYLSQHRYREEGIDSASSDMTNFVDSLWGASPSGRKGGRKVVGEEEGEREGTGIRI